MVFLCQVSDLRSDIADDVGGGNLELESADTGTDINIRKIKGSGMEICRKRLLHAHRRTSAADIAGKRKQFLHRNQVALLVARNLCRSLQVHFRVTRNHANEMAGPVPLKNKCLEDLLYRFTQLRCYMPCGKIILIHLIRYQL